MFKEMLVIAKKSGYEGCCIPPVEPMEYAFTSREEPNAAPVAAWKVRWFTIAEDGDKYTIHTAIASNEEAIITLRNELLYEDAAGLFIETAMEQAGKVKRLKASNLSPTAFAARFYGLEGTAAEKFASLLQLSKSPATISAFTRGEIEEEYDNFNGWSVSCMTTRSERTEIYDSSTDCAMLAVSRGEEKMGRVLIFRPRQLDSWKLSREEPLEESPTTLVGWYYTRVYGRGLHCGFTDSEGENYTRRAVESIGCLPGTQAPDGAVVCLSSQNDKAPWFDEYSGARLWWDGDEGYKCVVDFNNTAPVWVRDSFEPFYNNLRESSFSGTSETPCACCGESFDEENGGCYVDGTGDVCSSCLSSDYTWIDDIENYVPNDDAAQECGTEHYVVVDDYVEVERPHRSGSWVCCHGDEVEIDGTFYYEPDIENGDIAVLDWALRPKTVGNEMRLMVHRHRTVSEYSIDMEIDGETVKVGVPYEISNILSRFPHQLLLVAPDFGTRQEDFGATLWQVENGRRSRLRLTKFGSCCPVLVDENWTVVSTGNRSGSWVVGDQLSRYTEHRSHRCMSMGVGQIVYTTLSDRRTTLTVRSHNDSYGPMVIDEDRPYAFQCLIGYTPGVTYNDDVGHYYLTGGSYDQQVNACANVGNGFEILGYCSSYGNTHAHAVIYDHKVVRISHLSSSIDYAATRIGRIDMTTSQYCVSRSIEDLTATITAAFS